MYGNNGCTWLYIVIHGYIVICLRMANHCSSWLFNDCSDLIHPDSGSIGIHHAQLLNYPLVNVYKKLWKSPFLMGKLTISMAIFNSYFDITRGYIVSEQSSKLRNHSKP